MANGSSAGIQLRCTSFRSRQCFIPSVQHVYILFLLALLLLGGSCSAASLKSSMCRKIGTRTVIDEQGCDMIAVNVNMCSGFCPSLSFMNPLNDNNLILKSRCCRMIDVEMVSAQLKCGSEIREIKIPSALECSCFECA